MLWLYQPLSLEPNTCHVVHPILKQEKTRRSKYAPFLRQCFHLINRHSKDEDVVFTHFFCHLHVRSVQRSDRQRSVHLKTNHRVKHATKSAALPRSIGQIKHTARSAVLQGQKVKLNTQPSQLSFKFKKTI